MKEHKVQYFYPHLRKVLEKNQSPAKQPNLPDLPQAVVRLRRQKNMKSMDLCRKAGMDPKTLSAFEKGRIKNPSIKTLGQLAAGFGITISQLFRDAETKQGGLCFQGTKKGFCTLDFPQWKVKVIPQTPLIRDFFCGKIILGPRKRLDGMMMGHKSPVYLTVFIGKFEVTVESGKYELKEGDNLFFHGNLEHSFYNPLRREATLWLVTAPSML